MQGRKPSFQPILECLEERDLLAAHLTASLSGGLLTIEGTVRADTIVVREAHNRISVDGIDIGVAGREETSVSATAVKRIAIYGNGGNDRIYLNSQARQGQQPLLMPITVWGGAGNDLIVGGAGPERLYGGAGNDTIFAGNGNDLIDGGAGRNVLVGGHGADVFFSHSASDTIYRGTGSNTIDRLYEIPASSSHAPIKSQDYSPPARSPAPAPASPFQAQMNELIALTDAYRVSQGLNALRVNADLMASARYQSDYMARTGDYSHVNLDGRTLGDRAEAAGYTFAWVGEDIHLYDPSIGRTLGIDRYYPPSELAQYYFDGWQVSPEHNAILLSPNAVDVGVAIAQSPAGLIYATMDLGRLE